LNTNSAIIDIKKTRAFTQLLWIGIGAIGMFFAGLTSAYIVRKAEGNWLEFNTPDSFIFSTAIIIISSMLLIYIKRKIKNNDTPFIFMLSVIILGIFFALFQINGWRELTNQGVFLTGEGSNVSGSFLYVITLAHLVHLFGGLIALIIVSVNIFRKKYNANNYLGFNLAANYWHFLGILWLYLFLFFNYI
jgi:cytochrome c oxidase subunit 3